MDCGTSLTTVCPTANTPAPSYGNTPTPIQITASAPPPRGSGCTSNEPRDRHPFDARLRLPPVVFLGARTSHAVPNNAPMSRLAASRDPTVRLDYKQGVAVSRRANLSRALRRGLSHLQPTVLHSPSEESTTLASDAAVHLQRHVGVCGSRRAVRGMDFTDVALLASTVAGGTLFGITMHHHDDAFGAMRTLTVHDEPGVWTNGEVDLRPHISVASNTSGGGCKHRIEDVLVQRELKLAEVHDDDRRGRGHRSGIRGHQTSPTAVEGSVTGATEREACAQPEHAVTRVHERGGHRSDLFTVTMSRRLRDQGTNMALPPEHCIGSKTNTTKAERDARRQQRVQPPAAVANEFFEVQRRRHANQRGNTNAPLLDADDVPLSVELAYEHQTNRHASHVTYGGGTQGLLRSIFSHRGGYNTPPCHRAHTTT